MILDNPEVFMNNVIVIINRGSVKTSNDSEELNKIENKYNANCNTHTHNAMYYNFESNTDAFNFAKAVVKKFNYLSVTIRQAKD